MSSERAVRSAASTLKLSKENFVSHHSGTNLTELCMLVALVPCVAFLLQAYSRRSQASFSSTKLNDCVNVVLQFACIVLPTVLAVTSEALVWPLLWLVLAFVSLTACWSLLPHNVAMTRSLHHLVEQQSKRSGIDL